jgi:hypothetical protein
MPATTAWVLAAAAAAIALLVLARRGKREGLSDRLSPLQFGGAVLPAPAPGLTLYERPYMYPSYPADAIAVGARCTPYCAVPPCTTWCR